MTILDKILIPQDKANHAVYGTVIYGVLKIPFGKDIALGTVVIIAAAKEIIWDKLLKRGTPDPVDFVATIAPAILLYIGDN